MKSKIVTALAILGWIVFFGAIIWFFVWWNTADCKTVKSALPYGYAQNRCINK